MKTRMVEEREGEYLSPVDWTYDFRSHFDCYGTTDDNKQKYCDDKVEVLRKLSEHPELYEATTDGGWPRCGWGKVLKVGMWDGWPFWKPVPSVCLSTWAGSEWHAFSFITDIRLIKE